jgi:transcriptional regulator GlxA family with amidase domain
MKHAYRTFVHAMFLASLAPAIAHGSPDTRDAKAIDSQANKQIVEVFITEDSDFLEVAGVAHAFRDQLDNLFTVYLVSESRSPVKVRGGFTVVPDYAITDAPRPDILVIGTQGRTLKPTRQELDWLRTQHAEGRILLSVCDGADWLDAAGLLPPTLKLTRERPYLQIDRTTYLAGALSSGVVLALNFLDANYGRTRAQGTAERLGWDSSVFAGIPVFK